ncbi:hypothetical protein [Kiloniella majae]|uniref:hypothetical protein n=1 Tax=Kiloniella majae TaxID=1938558 RepID=UPI000A27911C|nr:hypothetical protein [Kiloniella majae]
MKFIFKALFAITLCTFISSAYADNQGKEEVDFNKFESTFTELTQRLSLDYKITDKKCEAGSESYCSYHLNNDSVRFTRGQKYSDLTGSATVVSGDRNKFLLLAINVISLIDPSLTSDELKNIVRHTVKPVTSGQIKRAEKEFREFKYWATAESKKVFLFTVIRK